jgi:hypothetical protein
LRGESLVSFCRYPIAWEKSEMALDSSVEAAVVAGPASVFMSGCESAGASLSELAAVALPIWVYAWAAAWACCTLLASLCPRCSSRVAVAERAVWSSGLRPR